MNHLASLRAALEAALPVGSPSRREFMALSGSAVGGAWLMGVLSGCESAGTRAATAMLGGEELLMFTEREGRDFEAFSALMIPTDETPGAREAGTVYFADQALASFFDFFLSTIRPGLADLSERAKAVEPSADGFASLNEEAQLDIVRSVEAEAAGFFGVARLLVMLGFASHPSYGGNRGKVGWQVLGFEDRFQYAPPFGAYDAPFHEGGVS